MSATFGARSVRSQAILSIGRLRGRFPAAKLGPYIVVQVLGAVAAGGVLYLIASNEG